MEEVNRSNDAIGRDSDGHIDDDDIDRESSDVEISDGDGEENLSDDSDGLMLNVDEVTLLQIKSNDPNVTSIAVHRFDHCIDGKDAGHYIGENSYLKRLLVEGESITWDERTLCMLGRFCKGFVQNRSIEDLTISLCELSIDDLSGIQPIMKKLQQFIIVRLAHFCEQNTNLRSLKIDCCNLEEKSTRVLAIALARKSNKNSLRRFNLFDNEINDVAAKELIESLYGYANLEELALGDNRVGIGGCTVLGNLISSPTTCLRQLNLQNNEIDDNGIAILTRAFIDNATLKEVNLSFNCDVTPSGWQLFFKCLQNPSSSIEQLSIGSNNTPDEAVATLGNALANNSTLNVLDFNRDHTHGRHARVTATGWRSFFACLHHSTSAMEYIILRGCSIDEEGLDVVANAIRTSSTLQTLDLSDNPQGNAAAWSRFFAACLRSPNSSLEGLFLCENFTDEADEMMADLARALAHNKTLEVIDLSENPSITNTGWSHFSRLLCDKSSVASIYESNHTINYLGTQTLPPDLDVLVILNEHENKSAVAREKILRYHFRHGANIEDFHNMKLEVIPHIISWLGRDCHWLGSENAGFTPLYELLRGLLSLFEPTNVAVAGTKAETPITLLALPRQAG